MKIITKQSLIAFACTLVLSPSVIKADKGNTSGGGGMLIAGFWDNAYSSQSALSVTKIGKSIITDFNVDLGNVIVDVEDENGFVVYSQPVNTSIVSQFTIDTFNFASGSYVITVTNAHGGIVLEEVLSIE